MKSRASTAHHPSASRLGLVGLRRLTGIPRSIGLIGLIGLIGSIGLASSCTAAARRPENQTTQLPGSSLAQAQPADVAVLPVRNQSGDQLVPVARMRTQLYRGLLDRLYSPLDVEYVDARWQEAAYDPSLIEADAVLHVVITGWNTRWLDDVGVLVAMADVYLLEPGGSTDQPIWGLSLTRRIDISDVRPALGGREALYRIAADRLTADMLGLLPARDPQAEPRTTGP